MERLLDEKLAGLKNMLSEMSELAETMISESVRALMEHDTGLLANIEHQEERLDRLQVEVDENCCRLLALYQPTAFDLRLLLGASRISTEVERLGDKAVNISQIAFALSEKQPIAPSEKFPQMARMASEMVHESIHAFLTLDVARARLIIQRDDALDDLKNQVTQELVDLMKRDSSVIDCAIQFLVVARNLERIGDHATNIAEDAIFVAEGRDVRHGSEPSPYRPSASNLDATTEQAT